MYEFPSLKKNSVGNGLQDHYKLSEIASKFIVQTDDSRSFVVFSSIDSYLEHFITCAEPMFHELMFANSPRKFFLDLDFEAEIQSVDEYAAKLANYNLHVNSIRDLLVMLFNSTYVKYSITTDDIMVVESHTEVTNYSGKIKLSSNLIIGKYLFPDQIEFVNFGKLVLSKYNSGTKIIDTGFFTTTTREFIQNRLVFNTKSSQRRFKYPVVNGMKITRPSTDIAKRYIMSSNIGVGGIKMETIEGTLRQVTARHKSLSFKVSCELVQNILNATKPYWESFTYRSAKEGLIEFDRIRSSHCNICDTVHDKDNTLMFIIEEGGKVFRKCRRNRYCEFIYLIPGHEPATPVAKPVIADNKWRRYFPTATIIDVDETHVSESAFPKDDINLVISEMKTGKSKSLIKHLSNIDFDKAVFVSFRRTFSAEASSKYSELGFVNYSSIEGEIDLDKHKRVIIQVESLSRLRPLSLLDNKVLILDEIESIWSQFSSTNFKDYNGSFNAFSLLLKRSDRVIAMDANMSDRTARLIKRVISGRSISVYINRYNPNHDYEFNIVDKGSWLFKIKDALVAKQKIAVFSNSLKGAREVKDFVKKFTGKVKIYSSKTKESVKRLHFSDVGRFWSQYDCIICTPTVSAGVSFEADHFDYVFGLFTDRSCNVETCRQMLGRVRNVKSREVYLSITSTYETGPDAEKFPTNIEVLKRNLAINRRDIIEMCGTSYNLHFMQYETDTDNGNAIYGDSLQLNIILENLAFDNHSRNNFYGLMLKQLSGEANGLSKLSRISTDRCKKYEDLIAVKTMFAEVAAETKKKIISGILSAEEIDKERFDEIKDKSSVMADVTTAEHNSVEQFLIKRITKVKDLDEKLVERFRSKNDVRHLIANRTVFASTWDASIAACLDKDMERLCRNNSKSESVIVYWGNIHRIVKEMCEKYSSYTNGNIDFASIVTGSGRLSELVKSDDASELVDSIRELHGILMLQYPILSKDSDIEVINDKVMSLLRYIYGFGIRQKQVIPMQDIIYKFGDVHYCNCKKVTELKNYPIVETFMG